MIDSQGAVRQRVSISIVLIWANLYTHTKPILFMLCKNMFIISNNFSVIFFKAVMFWATGLFQFK